MKRIFTTLSLIAAFTLAAKAQNSIQLNYGFRKPSGTEISQAFRSNDGNGITFLHKQPGSNWAFGGTWTSQSFSTDSSYFGSDYKKQMYINNLLFSLRKDARFKSGHTVYWGVDLGLTYYDLGRTDEFYKNEMGSMGFTTGFVLGSDWKIDNRFSIDVHGSYHYTYTDNIRYADKFTVSAFKYWGLNLGLKYQFGKAFKKQG